MRSAIAAMLLTLMTSVSAQAAVPDAGLAKSLDLLERAAPTTSHGAQRRLVGVAVMGKRTLAVGEMGLIIYSDDDGKSWTQAQSPTSVMLTAVAATDQQNAWIVGHDGVVLSSADRGAHWKRRFDGNAANALMLASARQLADRAVQAKGAPGAVDALREEAENRLADAEAASKAGPSQPLFGIHFLTAQHGFVAGAFGQLFETKDGGNQWDYIGARLDNPLGLHLNAISAGRDGALYLAAEAGVVFISRDAGATWSRAELGYKGHLYGVLELPSATARRLIAYGFGGHLFVSDDAGARWSTVPSPVKKAIVGSVLLADGTPILVTQDGRFLTAKDGSPSFTLLDAVAPLARVNGIAPGAGRDAVFLVGPQGIAAQQGVTQTGSRK